MQVHVNTGQLQYIRLAQPVSGTQVVQGQIQTLANTQQVITSVIKKEKVFISTVIGKRSIYNVKFIFSLDHADRGTAGTAAVQPVYRWTGNRQ